MNVIQLDKVINCNSNHCVRGLTKLD